MSLVDKKVSNLRERFKKQEEEKGRRKGGGNDPSFLNYFDLDFGESMDILFIPCADTGDPFYEYYVHGTNIKQAPTIACAYESTGDDCPACLRGFELYDQFNDTNDESFKKQAQLWRKNNKFIAQAIVIKSDIEVPDSPDDNLVKKVRLPFRVKENIVESVLEGIIDDPSDHIFRLKKTKNQGGNPDYSNSFFIQKVFEPPEELIEAKEAGMIKPYVLSELAPEATSTEDVQEWMDKVDEKLQERSSGKSGSTRRTSSGTTAPDKKESQETQGSGDSGDSEPPQEKNEGVEDTGTGESLKERLARFKQPSS